MGEKTMQAGDGDGWEREGGQYRMQSKHGAQYICTCTQQADCKTEV